MNYDYIHQCRWILQTELTEMTVRKELGGEEDNQWNWDKPASICSHFACVSCFGGFIFLIVLVWFGENFFCKRIHTVWHVNGLYISGGYYILLLSVCTISREGGTGSACSHIHCSTSQSQDMEATKVSMDRWMSRENVVCLCFGLCV